MGQARSWGWPGGAPPDPLRASAPGSWGNSILWKGQERTPHASHTAQWAGAGTRYGVPGRLSFSWSSTHWTEQQGACSWGVDVRRAARGQWDGGLWKGAREGGAGMRGHTRVTLTHVLPHSWVCTSTHVHTHAPTDTGHMHVHVHTSVHMGPQTGVWQPGLSAHTLHTCPHAKLLSH